MPGEKDNFDGRVEIDDPLKKIHATHARHNQVYDDPMRVLCVDETEASLGVPAGENDDIVLRKQSSNEFKMLFIVVDCDYSERKIGSVLVINSMHMALRETINRFQVCH